MRKLLFQFDSSRKPSVFDRVVAYDGGADKVLSCAVAEGDLRGLVYDTIFARGPKDLHSNAFFIGGTDLSAGQLLLAAARETFFVPFSF